MQHYLAVLTMVLLIGMVFTRARLLSNKGTKAFKFAEIDKKDFLILPFVLFYLYLIIASAFSLPTIKYQLIFESSALSWIGVAFCLFGLVSFLFSLISFGKSFRVGIDKDEPDKLITNGVFAFSRNPIYVSFGIILIGQFLVYSSWIFIIYIIVGFLTFHRQVLREEAFLKEHYGKEYFEYCQKVRRYI